MELGLTCHGGVCKPPRLTNLGLTGIFFLPDDALTGSHRDGLSAMVPVQAIL